MCADCFDLATEDHLGHLKQAEAADRRAKAEKNAFWFLLSFTLKLVGPHRRMTTEWSLDCGGVFSR